jgi:hypothetical protein
MTGVDIEVKVDMLKGVSKTTEGPRGQYRAA